MEQSYTIPMNKDSKVRPLTDAEMNASMDGYLLFLTPVVYIH